MINRLGQKFTDIFQKNMPTAFVFAILLTIIVSLVAFFWVGSTPLTIIESWYDGFWSLLEIGMQIVLIIITGYSIALSPIVRKGIDKLANYINSPKQVYFFVVVIGILLSMISFGWVVITSVLARELALRVKGVNYPFLIACVYFTMGGWVTGLSSSIPLLLNTENNYLIEANILSSTIPTSYTLGSSLNLAMIVLFVVFATIMIMLLIPKNDTIKELNHMLGSDNTSDEISIEEEAEGLKLPVKSMSDTLNNNILIQMIIVVMGLAYIIYHFSTKGFNLNFNIMIFIFLITGLFLHKTPMRYAISMQRASSNVSGILFQYPFYAGIMGIMLYTGLGGKLAEILASLSTTDNYAFFAYLTGGFVNFAIPSAGGEFAVVGPTILKSVLDISVGLPETQITAMLSRASMSIAYGESLSNLLQPFYLLLIFPVMGRGIKLQPRDVMGYLILPFLIFFIIQSIMVLYWPM